MRRALMVLWVVEVSLVAPLRADEVTVFAAASLSEAVGEVAKAFETSSGHKVVTSFGPSSFLAKQIKAGAKADLFFSADAPQVQGLIDAKLVHPEDRADILSNALVVVVPTDSKAAAAEPAAIPKFARIALADPAAVPAGVYAREWLKAQGLWEATKPKVVPLLDVRAALAAVESGNADAGIVYKTDAAVSKRVKVVYEVPPDRGPAIVYPLALVAASPKAASQKTAAREAFQFFASATAKEIYARRGFVVLKAR